MVFACLPPPESESELHEAVTLHEKGTGFRGPSAVSGMPCAHVECSVCLSDATLGVSSLDTASLGTVILVPRVGRHFSESLSESSRSGLGSLPTFIHRHYANALCTLC